MSSQINSNYAVLNQNFSLEKPKPSKFIFGSGNENHDWLIEFSENGFKFNHEAFPNATEDEFAKNFIEIMEKYYTIKFEKKRIQGIKCHYPNE